jgi:hypothetical protein
MSRMCGPWRWLSRLSSLSRMPRMASLAASRHHRASETAMAYRLSAVDQSSAVVVVTLAL